MLTVQRLPGPAPAGAVKYRAQGAAEALLYAREDEVLIEGPSGTGKSRACLEKLHLMLQLHPNSRAAMVRKTRESLTQSAMVTFEKEVAVENPPVCAFNHEDQEWRYGNGSVLTVNGIDKASKIMSSQYDLIYVQEATELEEADWEALLTRLRNNRMPYAQLLADCNPDAPMHWLNLRCADGKTRRLLSRHEDNPTITPAYLAKLDSLTGVRYKRLRLGLWVASEGQYFEEWDEDQHICPAFEVPSTWSRWASVDYGFSDPFSTLWFARNPQDKSRIYIYRESYGAGLRDVQQARLLSRLSEGERISVWVGDPSMFNKRSEQDKPSIATVYWREGRIPLRRAVNNRIPGWQIVRDALYWTAEKPPRLQVMRGRAPNLVRTLPMMVADPLDSEDLADKIKSRKTEDHAVDALRYGLVLEAMPPRQQAELMDFRVEE